MKKKSLLLLIIFLIVTSIFLFSKDSEKGYVLNVDPTKEGISMSPTLYGAFFEEINNAADGGMYAELIYNRSFENDLKNATGWFLEGKGEIELIQDKLMNETQVNALRIAKDSKVINKGFYGISVKKDEIYDLSLFVKGSGTRLTFSLVDSKGNAVSEVQSHVHTSDTWEKVQFTLKGTVDSASSQFMISVEDSDASVDLISLMPPTWGNTSLRKDLAQKVADMNPMFLRFPGGCFLEGNTVVNSYRWKETIGPLEDRSTQLGYWGYYTSNGLGYHDYLEWARSMGAKPLYVTYVGISHEGHPFTTDNYVPMEDLDVWIQDALDAIEYANGDETTYWGKKRIENGSVEPFNLEYIEVGNENNFQYAEYLKRYPVFYKAIKEKYPDINIISNADMPGKSIEIVDEHYYESSQWFVDHQDMYDSYDRNGPKIYVGEYAVTKNAGKGNMNAALGEAVYMLGLERNSDHVIMSSYAPLLVNDNNRNWDPNAIVFNASNSFGTPSYHTQSLFSNHKGDAMIEASLNYGDEEYKVKNIVGNVGVGSWLTQVEYDDFKVKGDSIDIKDSFDEKNKEWTLGFGKWEVKDGLLVQSSNVEGAFTTIGDSNAENYTITTKARKTGGSEGFLVLFGNTVDGSQYWWNVGGWNNTASGIEKNTDGSKRLIGETAKTTIKKDVWYELKVEVKGNSIKAYIDGVLVHDVVDDKDRGPLHYGVSIDHESDEIIVKLVNRQNEDEVLTIKGLDDYSNLTMIQMSAEASKEENSFANPKKISPIEEERDFTGDVTLKGNSINILRFSKKRGE